MNLRELNIFLVKVIFLGSALISISIIQWGVILVGHVYEACMFVLLAKNNSYFEKR